ncbi:MAG: phosphonate C-P lyase system protein PhnL [Mesorhizobium amorphae]|nr:MAG: phosphonate C-P lyase system protein PhnL [Mesorhizobium amorphae]
MTAPVLSLRNVAKDFTLHLRGGNVIPVMADVSFDVMPGECAVLGGPSGIGKSSILKMVYGNYRASTGSILLRDGAVQVDITKAEPREVLRLRGSVVGYVSQFLRVIPRVSALDIVAEAARGPGVSEREAREHAEHLLALLALPPKLWPLPPATFSGGEQQRVNIARGLAAPRALLLLDEPTASLDARNRETVMGLIESKKREGVAILGIFHDEDVRDAVASRIIDVSRFAPAPKEPVHA